MQHILSDLLFNFEGSISFKKHHHLYQFDGFFWLKMTTQNISGFYLKKLRKLGFIKLRHIRRLMF